MANDSATGGYLPYDPKQPGAPLYGRAFVDFLQEIFVGVSGIPGPLVRPRWQPEPPNRPDRETDWLAFGLARYKADVTSYEKTDKQTLAFSTSRTEEFHLLLSFYGPYADGYAAAMRDGLSLAQNREKMIPQAMTFIEAQDINNGAEKVKGIWYDRFDMLIRMRRRVLRVYPVLSLLSFKGTLLADTERGLYTEDISVKEP